MKYAFILGTSAFITPRGVINYEANGESITFLKIRSIYHDVAKSAEQSVLSVEATIQDLDGTEIKINGTTGTSAKEYTIKASRDNLQVLRKDGSTIFEVHQMDDKSAMGLEHYITAELEIHAPIVVIRVRGDFKLGGIHILAENEKLFVGSSAYATAALVSHNDILFTPSGVVL